MSCRCEFSERETNTLRERESKRARERVAFKKSSDCKNSVIAFISFQCKKIMWDIKATQILLSHISAWPDSGTVWKWIIISLFHSFSSKRPNEATSLRWRQGLCRGVLLVACTPAGGRQKRRRELPSQTIIAFRFFIHAGFLPSGRQRRWRWKGERRLRPSASSCNESCLDLKRSSPLSGAVTALLGRPNQTGAGRASLLLLICFRRLSPRLPSAEGGSPPPPPRCRSSSSHGQRFFWERQKHPAARKDAIAERCWCSRTVTYCLRLIKPLMFPLDGIHLETPSTHTIHRWAVFCGCLTH